MRWTIADRIHYTKKPWDGEINRCIAVRLSSVVTPVSWALHGRATLHTMFDVILYEPEIPPNTGNIIRLCANTGARLHLVKPLGFSLEDKQLLRAGLDYHEFATITVHESWADCLAAFNDHRLYAVSTKGTQRYDLVEYAKGDTFVFGPESRGLPTQILRSVSEQHCIRVPMVPGNRSLNLSNAVSVVLYEAWRQIGFGMCR
ncbi:MAG TPA: tRNA (uridine(34)/cytosine(34)/5-carboxymethylaminomethyluridine(34)-2'-O)-methyltransferase TrmL [Nitrospiraceae bacterium]|nr:tRNA (uridine(34)/cytosine(34)/5-carboxymethylaminomethyluridine(34)-2'-O)-methyltransferase TrmL [Nitrospiraceae bacterium]